MKGILSKVLKLTKIQIREEDLFRPRQLVEIINI